MFKNGFSLVIDPIMKVANNYLTVLGKVIRVNLDSIEIQLIVKVMESPKVTNKKISKTLLTTSLTFNLNL